MSPRRLAAIALALALVWLPASADEGDRALVLRALDRVQSLELYALDPDHGFIEGSTVCAGECYFSVAELGKAEIDRGVDRRRVIDELRRWLAGPEPNAVSLCFSPHHGVHVRVADDSYDFVVCFECGRMDVYRNGNEALLTVHGAGGGREAADAWNALLARRGITPWSPDSPQR